MIQQNEIITLLLGAGVFFFIELNRTALMKLPSWNLLRFAFYALLCGWILTVLEGLFWTDTLNFLEHICYAVSSLALAGWCYRVFGRGTSGS
ncbi:MAG: hypothetical protein JW821_04875 [Deltaproteobacteria bacterium]|nr:hypothetical protein [Deltaproteobacteria bacterium]